MRREKIEYLSFYRAIAILAVLMIHATSQAVANMQTSSLYYGYVFANIFSKFAVPSFIFLTGFVLFYNYADKGLKRSNILSFYSKRLKFILVPYFIASLCYFALIMVMRDGVQLNMKTLSALVEDLLTGSAYAHLYYIFVLVQFYILFPLHLMAARSKTFVKYSIVIGLAIQWAFILINKYEWHVPQKGSIFLSYISFWMLGSYIGINWDRCKAWLQSLFNPAATKAHKWWNFVLWLSWLVIALAHVQVWYWYNLRIWMMNSLGYEALFNIHSLLSCLILIQISSLIQRRAKGAWTRLLNHLGEVSFGIYLLHPVILLVYRKFPWHGGSPTLYPIFVIGGFVVALAASWIIVGLLSRFSWSWMLFGSNTKTAASKKAAKDTTVVSG
ncbi:acyltransferase [Paenibacillus marinisediminis]